MYRMNIFGPPGVGKLSVAKELARRTGFKLIDNHTTIDWARRFFEFGTPEFWRLEYRLRSAVLEEATAEGLSLIGTWLAPTPVVISNVNQWCGAAEAAGGRCCFVQLTCEQAVLEQRIQSPGRSEAGKLTSVEVLHRMMASTDFFSPATIPGYEGLFIDNTHLSPTEVTDTIVKHYQFPTV